MWLKCMWTRRCLTNLQKKLNNVKGDEVDVIDGVEAKAVVEGEDEAEGQVNG